MKKIVLLIAASLIVAIILISCGTNQSTVTTPEETWGVSSTSDGETDETTTVDGTTPFVSDGETTLPMETTTPDTENNGDTTTESATDDGDTTETSTVDSASDTTQKETSTEWLGEGDDWATYTGTAQGTYVSSLGWFV